MTTNNFVIANCLVSIGRLFNLADKTLRAAHAAPGERTPSGLDLGRQDQSRVTIDIARKGDDITAGGVAGDDAT